MRLQDGIAEVGLVEAGTRNELGERGRNKHHEDGEHTHLEIWEVMA